MDSYFYSVYGHSLASNVALPSLVPTTSSPTEFSFAWKPPRLCSPGKVTWLHHWRHPEGGDWLYSAQTGKGYLLRLRRAADFWLSRDGRKLSGLPLCSLSPELMDHLLVNHILPFALTLRGLRVFHASASCLNGRAVLFLGDAGAGKSTLAALLLARGFPPLTDDCAVVVDQPGAPAVLPSHPTLRLWPAVEEAILGGASHSRLVGGKRTLRLDGPESFHARTAALSNIYVLAPGSESAAPPALESLRGPQALIRLIAHSYRLDFSDRPLLAREVENLGDLVESVGVKQLSFSPTLEGLAHAAELVLSDVGP